MVRFWFVDAKKWKNPIPRSEVLKEAHEAVSEGADGLRIVAPSFGPSAYDAKEMIESNDTNGKGWDDLFYSIKKVKLDIY